MKVALLSPYQDIHVVGIRLISAVLKQHGHSVQLIFLPRSFLARYPSALLKQLGLLLRDCDLVGISCMSQSVLNVIQLTRHLRNATRAAILWGGVHPTLKPDECLRFADMICVGEGEEAVVDLVRAMESGKPVNNIPGIWVQGGSRIVRPLIQNLDLIPFPDHKHTEHLISQGNAIVPLTRELVLEYTHGTYFGMASRGCPYGCSFCANNAINKLYPKQKLVRFRSPENMVGELVWAKANLPVSRVLLDDDAFFMNKTENIERFSGLYKEQVRLPLSVLGAAPTTLTEEKLAPLVDAGLEGIRLGIQSAAEDTRKLYRRDHSTALILKAIRIIEQFPNIRHRGYDVILDNPWESAESVKETLLFLTQVNVPFDLILYGLEYYPGTVLHEKALADGIAEDTIEAQSSSTYLGWKRTWINALFVLLRDCAAIGVRISTEQMRCMLEKRPMGILLYLHFRLIGLRYRFSVWRDLVRFAIQDVRRFDFSRVFGFVMTRCILKTR